MRYQLQTSLTPSIVGLIGCTLTLDGKPLVANTAECDGLGVLFHAIIFSQHCWTLGLAFATFMILTKPLHIVTSWIEKYWYWSWLAVWVISFGVSVITYVIYGYEPAGGVCYLGNNTGIFGELIQFIPRAVVFLFISFFYGRLYVFLRRPDKIRSGFSDNSAGESSYSRLKGSWMRNSRRRLPFIGNRETKTVIIDAKGARVGIDTTESRISQHPNGSKTSVASIPKPKPPPLVAANPMTKSQRSAKAAPADDIPPWERIELPLFQVDGQKYGGSAPNSRESTWAEWRFSNRRPKPTIPLPSAATAVNTPSASPLTSPLTAPNKPSFDKTLTIPKSIASTISEGKLSPTATTFSSSSSPLRAVHDFRVQSNYDSDHTGFSNTTTAVEGGSHSRSSSQASGSSVPGSQVTRPQPAMTRDGPWPLDNLDLDERRPSLPNIASDAVVTARRRRPSLLPPTLSALAASAVAGLTQPPGRLARAETVPSSGADLEKGFIVLEEEDDHATKPAAAALADADADADDDDDDDDEWDLKRFLANEPVPEGDDRFAVTQPSENHEYVAESMASYLNRKTALLMLWFPLGYVVLFSVSLVHIIYDFAGSPPEELRAISRWMIFGQGLLDGIIYGIVEWHTKRVVRKRVRKGTFSPRTSHTGGSGMGSHLRAFSNPFRQYHHSHNEKKSGVMSTASGTVPPSQVASRNRSPQVSFVDPESSIMQRLDVRKGGVPTLDEY